MAPKKEASKYASNDYIQADADEYLDKDLIDYANNIKHFDNRYDFAFRRKNFCGDEWIKVRHCHSYVTRLYDKTKVNYDPRVDHAAVKSKKTTKVKAHIIILTNR